MDREDHTVLVRFGRLLNHRHEIVELLLPLVLILQASLLQIGIVPLEQFLLGWDELHGKVGSADGDGCSTVRLRR